MVDLAIIVVSYNTKELTLSCLQSVYNKRGLPSFEVVVVDNNSQDGSTETIRKRFPRAQIISNSTNTGFAVANNQGMRAVSAHYYLLLNSDTEVLEDSLIQLLRHAKEHDFGVSSCKLLNKDLSLQQNAGALPSPVPVVLWLSGGDDFAKKIGINVSAYHELEPLFYRGTKGVGWVAGTAMLIRGDVYKTIGGLDEKIFMYAEDVDYCWRAQENGFLIGWTDAGSIIHLGGGSSSSPRYTQWRGEFRSLVYLYQKYYGFAAAVFLKLLILFFTTTRIMAFAVLGKFDYAKTYAKILITL